MKSPVSLLAATAPASDSSRIIFRLLLVMITDPQVWPLTQFFLIPFPRREKTFLFCLSQQLPRLCLEPLKGTLRCVALGTEVPGHRQEQTYANLDCNFAAENALFLH